MFLIWLNAESILLLLNQDPEVAHLAAVYLRWASLGLPGMVFDIYFFCAANNNDLQPMHLTVLAGEQHLFFLQRPNFIFNVLPFSVATSNLKVNMIRCRPFFFVHSSYRL